MSGERRPLFHDDSDEEEDGWLLLIDRSHSHDWVVLKVFIRSLFCLVLVSCLAFHVLFHHDNVDSVLKQPFHGSTRVYETLSNSIVNRHFYARDSVIQLANIKPLANGLHYVANRGNTGDQYEIYTDPSQVRVSEYLHHTFRFTDVHIHSSLKLRGNLNGRISHFVSMKEKENSINSFAEVTSADGQSSTDSASTVKPRERTNIYMKIFQNLLHENLLNRRHKVAFLGQISDMEEIALEMVGFEDVINIHLPSKFDAQTHSYHSRGITLSQIPDSALDFAFTKAFDDISYPGLFISEIERTLKEGGFAAMLVSLNTWCNRYLSSEPGHGIKPVTLLFRNSEIVYVTTTHAPGFDTLIVFKKNKPQAKVADIYKKTLRLPTGSMTYRQQPVEYKSCFLEHIQSDLWYLMEHQHEPYILLPAELSNHVWECFELKYPESLQVSGKSMVLSTESAGRVPFIILPENTAWFDVIEKVISSGQSDYYIQVGVTGRGFNIPEVKNAALFEKLPNV